MPTDWSPSGISGAPSLFHRELNQMILTLNSEQPAMAECIECGAHFTREDDETIKDLTNRVIEHLMVEHGYFA